MAASLTKTQSYAKPWKVQTSGQPLTTPAENEDTTGKYLWIRQRLETTDPAVSPSLSLMEVELSGEAPVVAGGGLFFCHG